MFSQSADKPAADQSDAPAGMRELPPQPAKPAMPGYATPTPTAPVAPGTHEPESRADDATPGPDDSVIAVDDHLEGIFTSRGTVVVKGSVKGRIEAIQVRIEDGATVDADVIVDEAIIAGEFTGNLTCRERLEARSSGRISGRVETFKLMLHEGASVEGEMHMLTEAPTDASETIRGSAPLRGETEVDQPRTPATPAAPAAKKPPTVKPPSGARPTPAVGTSTSGSAASSTSTSDSGASVVRSSVVETLKTESARVVAPRTTTTRGYGYSGDDAVSSGSAKRTTTSGTGF
jgi:cytoskeletal protein CcmA (bactofilin family)